MTSRIAHESVAFRWLGVSGLIIQAGNATLALDPFVTRPRMRYLWSGRVEPNETIAEQLVSHCDVILITHAHFDHLMDAPGIARRTGATLCGTPNTCTLAIALGVPQSQVRMVTWGDSVTLPSFEIQVWPGDHPWIPGFTPGPLASPIAPPLRLRDYRMDECLSFLVQTAGWQLLIYHAQHVVPLPQADVLCISMAQPSAFYEQVLHQVRPRLVIPLHWDDMFRPLTAPLRPFWRPPRRGAPLLRHLHLATFEAMITKIAPVRVLVPEPLREYDLNAILGDQPPDDRLA